MTPGQEQDPVLRNEDGDEIDGQEQVPTSSVDADEAFRKIEDAEAAAKRVREAMTGPNRGSAAGDPPGDVPTSSAAGPPPEGTPVGNAELTRLGQAESNLELRQRRKALHRRIENDFVYHPPDSPETTLIYQKIRARAREYAHELVELCPPSRELSRALSDLEDCVTHANASVARHG